MKNGIYIILVLLFWSCSPDAVVDCFTRSGNTEIRLYEVEAFDQITIRQNIELHITHSDAVSLSIEAGNNLINNIDLNVENGHLDISAKDLCPSGRKNPAFIVHLSTPNLTEIRNASQFKVVSKNTLNFENLRIISENSNDGSALAVGDFELDVQLEKLNIIHSGLSDFSISGNTNELSIGVYSGSGRIFAEHLIANKIQIYLRGFGNVHVFPVEEIKGELRSTGNLILYNQPPIQQIETFFTGEVIFNTE